MLAGAQCRQSRSVVEMCRKTDIDRFNVGVVDKVSRVPILANGGEVELLALAAEIAFDMAKISGQLTFIIAVDCDHLGIIDRTPCLQVRRAHEPESKYRDAHRQGYPSAQLRLLWNGLHCDDL